MNQTINLSDNPTVGELREALSHFNEFDHIRCTWWISAADDVKTSRIVSVTRVGPVVEIQEREAK